MKLFNILCLRPDRAVRLGYDLGRSEPAAGPGGGLAPEESGIQQLAPDQTSKNSCADHNGLNFNDGGHRRVGLGPFIRPTQTRLFIIAKV